MTTRPEGSGTQSAIAVADVNGDGAPDLLVASYGGAVSVLLGNGLGGFGAAATYAVGRSPSSVTAADVNGDGKLDLIVADNLGGVSVLLGTGGGSFGAAVTYAAGPAPRSVTTADVNGDQKVDLVVADNSGGVSVLLGDGSGGFGAALALAAGQGPAAVTTADTDGDGKPDIAVVGTGGLSVLRDTSLAPGTFNTASAPTAPGADTGIVIDAAPTITAAVANPATGTLTVGQAITFTLTTSKPVTVTGTPTLTLNDGGTATYVPGSSTATSLVFTTIVAAGQYAAALAVTGVSVPPGASILDAAGNAALLQGADVTFSGLTVSTPVIVTAIAAVPSHPGTLAVGDSVTFTLTISRSVTVTGSPVLTLSDGATASFNQAASGGTSLVFGYTVAAGQSSADLLVSALSLNGATVPGALALAPAVTFAAGPTPFSVATADLNGDGKVDAVIADQAGGVAVLLGDGSGGFGAAATYAAGPMPRSVAVADVNGDGKLDLAVADQTGGVAVLLGNGSGGFAAAVTYAAGPSPYAVTVADVNGDGRPDLIAADYNGGVSVLLGNGSGGFAAATHYAAGPFPLFLSASDLNADGIPDLVVADQNATDQNGGVSVLLGNGSGGFGLPTNYAAGPNNRTVTVADVDGDGRPDLIVGDQAGGVAVRRDLGRGRR